MAKSKLKLKARSFRRAGKSIREISNLTGISISTVSFWCRDIKLSNSQKRRLIIKERSPSYAGRMLAAERAKLHRLEVTKKLNTEGIREVAEPSDREIFFAGVGLYWGEGYRSQEMIGFTSKDPQIIRFIIFWFKKFLGANNKDFILRVGLNSAHKHRIKTVTAYWEKLTNIPSTQFTKPSFIKAKHNKIFENPENYFGTLRITLRKSRNKHRKFMGWIDGLYKKTVK